METKNSILARQKEMQLSLEKVKHLIRLIQAFNFNQALAETEGKDVRVLDRAQGAAGAEAAPEANSVEKVKAASFPVSGTPEEQQTAGAPGGGADSQPDSTVLTANNCPAAGAGAKAEPGVGAHTEAGLQVEVESKPETETAAAGEAPATVATTNGTAEPPCPDHSPAATTNSENKMAAVNPAETAVEKKQEELTDSDGSNTNNSKTSEPSQHSLPALVSSLDNKK